MAALAAEIEVNVDVLLKGGVAGVQAAAGAIGHCREGREGAGVSGGGGLR